MSEDLNAKAIMRQMRQQEDENRQVTEHAAAIRKRVARDAMKRNFVISALALLVVAAGVGGFLKWKSVRSARIAAEHARIVREAEADRLRQEIESREWKERRARDKAERDARLQEQRAEWQKQRDAMDAKLKQQRDEQQRQRAEQEAEIAKERAQDEKLRLAREKYRLTERSLEGAHLFPWRMLPAKKRPGAVEGTFLGMIPQGGREYDLFEVVSHADGRFSVCMMMENGALKELPESDYVSRVSANGAVVYNGEHFYLIPPRGVVDSWSVTQDYMDPARLKLGSLAEKIQNFGMNTETLRFVVSIDSEGKSLANIETRFGDRVTRADVKEAIMPAVEKLVPMPRQAVKKRKRTVVMYDGNIIKRQMNGVTLVPRNPTPAVFRDRRYSDLCAEAARQESEDSGNDVNQRLVDDRRERIEAKAEALLSSAKVKISIKAMGDVD